MDEVKGWLTSKTIMGPLLSVIAYALQKVFKIDIGLDDALVDQIILLVGIVTGIIGRFMATKQVTPTKPV